MMGAQPYPCNAGTNSPMGWHNYTKTPYGVVCTKCGYEPRGYSNSSYTTNNTYDQTGSVDQTR